MAQHALTKDPKSRLQEWVQAATGQTPRYRTVHTEGPDHARLFTRQVTIGKQPYGVGQGQSKQEAEQGCGGDGAVSPGADDARVRRQRTG